MHVHSTFSDGKGTLEENIAEAERLGLRQLGCVDHVRVDTDWVPDYVAAVQRVREQTSVQMQCGIEAKILDTAGRLDMPEGVDGVDAVYAADHQVPSADGPLHPRAVREGIESGELRADAVVADIVNATIGAVRVNSNVVIAHLFSILPKIGVDEATVDGGLIEQLADAAAETGARIEIDERWSCPSARTVRPFIERGVPLLLSTDSHRPETIGRYDYCRGVYSELTGIELTPVD
jgi:putative hydrolase